MSPKRVASHERRGTGQLTCLLQDKRDAILGVLEAEEGDGACGNRGKDGS